MNILLLDDDTLSLKSVANALRISGYSVRPFATPSQAQAALDSDTFDVVITDYHLTGEKGTFLINYLHRKQLSIPVIIISGDPSPKTEKLSIQAGARAFFSKPLDLEKIDNLLKALV